MLQTEATEYAKSLAAELRAAIRAELIDFSTMTVAGNCQTSQCFTLSVGIFEPEEYKKAYARLIDIINENGRKLDTGVIGLRHIFEVLIKGGDAELALELIKNIYDEFLDGDDPVFQSAIVHIGTDEASNASKENMRRYISDLSQYVLGKENVAVVYQPE